jgi:hypothetical protein
MVTTAKLSDIDIAAVVVPTSLRWPNTTVTWEKLKECVDLLRGLVRAADNECVNAENNPDFSLEGIQPPP